MTSTSSPVATNNITCQRNSSVELYRIIAVFSVLVAHYYGWFLGGVPERFDYANLSSFRIGQIIIEALTCICVNMFIIISGYFGIKLKIKSVLRIYLLLLLIFIPFYIVRALLLHEVPFSIYSLVSRLFAISHSGYFVQCYLMLMFFSPVLNTFIEKYGRKILPWCLFFVIIEIWFGCVMNVESFGYMQGYSIIHFITVYMVARCLFLYQDILKNIKIYVWIIGYICCTFLIILMYLNNIDFCWDYSNPLVVISAICSFLPFTYFNWSNKKINWIAKNTFAVYLIHVFEPVKGFLMRIDEYLLFHFFYFEYLVLSFVILLIVFVVGVIYEKCAMRIIDPIIRRLLIVDYSKFHCINKKE